MCTEVHLCSASSWWVPNRPPAWCTERCACSKCVIFRTKTDKYNVLFLVLIKTQYNVAVANLCASPHFARGESIPIRPPTLWTVRADQWICPQERNNRNAALLYNNSMAPLLYLWCHLLLLSKLPFDTMESKATSHTRTSIQPKPFGLRCTVGAAGSKTGHIVARLLPVSKRNADG